MTRKTEVTPESEYHKSSTFQEKLDAFWNLIEDMYEDEWRVEFSGALILRVDDEMLERVLADNVGTAWYKFGSFRGGQTEKGNRFFISRPEELKGLYSITGVYNERQALVDGPRFYMFEQGA